MSRRILVGALAVATAAGVSAFMLSGVAAGKTGKAQVLPSSSCGPLQYSGPKPGPKVIIASDLPLQGATRPQTLQMGRVAVFLIRAAKWQAGKVTVGYQACDDSTPQAGAWDAAKCTANAQAYAADKSVGLIIGTFNSGCAKLEIPINNRAGLQMLSPANTYPGLTHAVSFTAAGEPDIYYPTGKRTYARVVATDEFQGAAAATFVAKNLQAKSVYILTDNQTYGKGIADGFQFSSKKLGVEVKGYEAWDPKASSYEALANKVKESGAEAVYLGGIICNNGGKLLKDLRAVLGPDFDLVGPDGWTPFDAVASASGGASEGMYVTVAGPALSALTGPGKIVRKAFEKTDKKKMAVYAAYMAQAIAVGLDAIKRSNGTRASISAAVYKTDLKNSFFGDITFDKNGDIKNKAITVYRFKGSDAPPLITIIPLPSIIG